MQVQRSAGHVVVHAPAKLNLFFEALAKRGDGYHEIETLMCPVDLYDTLCFGGELRGQIRLQCERVIGFQGPSGTVPGGTELCQLPEGRENLVFRAAESLRRQAGGCWGAAIRLVKRIPASAGLGGGSSDAAAALVAANVSWGLGRSLDQLASAAIGLGSDVPFFLTGGAAVCRGRGERVEPVGGLGALHFVVVRPPEGLSTERVYRLCRPAREPRAVGPLLAALSRGDLRRAGGLLFNRLESAAATLSPWIERLQREFAGQDVLGHGMSGSGTSYFGLCRHARHARRVARRLQANGVGHVFAVRSCR